MKVVIDLSGIRSRMELHKILRLHLGLPPYYGNNLNALHDCLTEIHSNTLFVFLNAGEAPENMRPYYATLKKVLDDRVSTGDFVRYLWFEGAEDSEYCGYK